MPGPRKSKKVVIDEFALPGPTMGPRPHDFDEEGVRKSPTFVKWSKLKAGEKLRYACRDFVKGFGDDEERLMRRIMIARRNNLKDHAVLKRARAVDAEKRGAEDGIMAGDKSKAKTHDGDKRKKSSASEVDRKTDEAEEDVSNIRQEVASASDTKSTASTNPPRTKRRRLQKLLEPSDEEIMMEMDLPAVEATRSYRKWITLYDGESFSYNQTYLKGRHGDDWLLKKNIWRRMRYRRENRKMVEELKSGGSWTQWKVNASPKNPLSSVKHDTLKEEDPLVSQAVVDAAVAAVAAAEANANETGIDADAVAALGAEAINDPLIGCEMQQISGDSNADDGGVRIDVTSALDAAAKLAATVVPMTLEGDVSADLNVCRVEV